MASITQRRLDLQRDRATQTVKAVATCRINFTTFEVNQMKEGLQFRLRCKLMGADSGLTGSDDDLFTYTPSRRFPDSTPTASENVTFEETLGDDVLNEDLGTDEIYARFLLTNLFTQITVRGNSPEVSGNF